MGPADAATRLAGDVAAGFLVVTLKRPVLVSGRERFGWWRIDPVSGETIGVMDSGFHQGTVDRALGTLTGVFTLWLTKFDAATAARMVQRAHNVSYQEALAMVFRMRELLFAAIVEINGK